MSCKVDYYPPPLRPLLDGELLNIHVCTLCIESDNVPVLHAFIFADVIMPFRGKIFRYIDN